MPYQVGRLIYHGSGSDTLAVVSYYVRGAFFEKVSRTPAIYAMACVPILQRLQYAGGEESEDYV